jgi:hypothetical protein
LISVLAGWDYHKSANSQRTINLKITPVDGRNPASPLAFGNAYQCRIRASRPINDSVAASRQTLM